MEHLDAGIRRRLVAAGTGLDHPVLVLAAREAKEIGVGGGSAGQDTGGDAGCRDCGGLPGNVVRFALGLFGEFLNRFPVSRPRHRDT